MERRVPPPVYRPISGVAPSGVAQQTAGRLHPAVHLASPVIMPKRVPDPTGRLILAGVARVESQPRIGWQPGLQPARFGVLQRAKLEEEKAFKVTSGKTVGDWTLDSNGASADLWSSGSWKMSYYRASGDYHIKGKSGARAKSWRGLFSGVYQRNASTVPIGTEMDSMYDAWVQNVLPLYK